MTREECIKKLYELSCTHAHLRVTECALCMAEFEPIIVELTKEKKDE